MVVEFDAPALDVQSTGRLHGPAPDRDLFPHSERCDSEVIGEQKLGLRPLAGWTKIVCISWTKSLVPGGTLKDQKPEQWRTEAQKPNLEQKGKHVQ